MNWRPSNNVMTALLISVQLGGLGLAVVHPLAPYLLILGMLGIGFAIAYHHLIITLLGNLNVIKAVLITSVPALAFIDPIIILAILAYAYIIWTVGTERGRQAVNRHGHLLLAVVAWIGFVLMSTIYAPMLGEALVKAGRFAFIVPALFLGPLVLIQSSRDARLLLGLFIALGVISALLLYAKMWGIATGSAIEDPSLRLSILGTNPIATSRILVVSVAMIAAAIIGQTLSAIKWMPVIIFLLGAALLTGSRGPLLSLLLAGVVLGLLYAGRPRRILLGGILSVVILVAIFLLLAPEGMTGRYFALTQGELGISKQGLRVFSTVVSRFRLWEIALESWTSSSFNLLFGTGVGGYAALITWRDYHYPHNLLLEVLVEFGLVGAAVFSWQIALVFRRLFSRSIQQISPEASMWLAAIFTFFISTMFSGDINDNRLLWYFLAAYIATLSLKTDVPAQTAQTDRNY